jgi:hypothetical protein
LAFGWAHWLAFFQQHPQGKILSKWRHFPPVPNNGHGDIGHEKFSL